MSSSKSFQHSQSFTPYRPGSPKISSYSPILNQTSQNNSHVIPSNRGKNSSQSQVDHLSSIHYENTLLREQNKALRREINLIKGQFLSKSLGNGSEGNSHQMNDLRETIKKQAGEIKELKTRLEVVSKQSKMYEEIIDKMEGKINKLTEQNKVLENKLKQAREAQRTEKDMKYQIKSEEAGRIGKQGIARLSEKINQITSMYLDLEEKVQQSDKEWELWKEKWSKEKFYYLNRIHDLQAMLGIGVENKQFYKKRF